MQTIEKETRVEKKLKTKDVDIIMKEYLTKLGLDEEFEITIKRKDGQSFKPLNRKVIYLKPMVKETQLIIGEVYMAEEESESDYMIEVDGVTSSYPKDSFELYDGRKKYDQPIISNIDYELNDSTYFTRLYKGDEELFILTDSINRTYLEMNKEGYHLDVISTFHYNVETRAWYAVTNSLKTKILNGEPKSDNTVFGKIQDLAKQNKLIIK